MSALVELDQIRATLSAEGQPFEIKQAQVNGFTLPVYKNLPTNLTHLIVQAQNFSERVFLVSGERRLSYKEVLGRASGLAVLLRTQYGIKPNVRVAVAMRNSPEWIIAYVAILLAGATAVLVNSRGAPDEILHALHGTDCTLVIADPKRAAAAAGGFAGTILITEDDGGFHPAGGAVLDIKPAPLETSAAATDDPAIIMFTSGTTGRPKGAVLSHRSVYSAMFNVQHRGLAMMIHAAKRLGMEPSALIASTPQSTSLAVMPFFHVSGAEFTILIALMSGGKIVIPRRWDAAAALSLIARERVTQFSGPPSIFWDILAHPDLGTTDISSLKSISAGGQATPPQLLDALVKAFPAAALGGGWGMTETNGAVVTSSGEEFLLNKQASGRLLPIAELRVIGDQGSVLPAGEIGEICVKSVLVMTGYWNQPEANREVFEAGWLRTGDIGFIDADRYVTIVDRKKDMILSAGENIYCAELERVVNQFPGVRETAAFGVPDVRLGERAVVVVVPLPGHQLDTHAIIAFARSRLADYKVPSDIICAETPFVRNAVGKIDRNLLRTNYSTRSVLTTQGADA